MLVQVNGTAPGELRVARRLRRPSPRNRDPCSNCSNPDCGAPFWIAVVTRDSAAGHRHQHGAVLRLDHLQGARRSAQRIVGDLCERGGGRRELRGDMVALGVIDGVGRRPLLMLSRPSWRCPEWRWAWRSACSRRRRGCVLTIMLFCVAAFAIGLGPGFWVLLAEIFPTASADAPCPSRPSACGSRVRC